MIYPRNRFQSSSSKGLPLNKGTGALRIVVPVFLLIAAAGIVYFLSSDGFGFLNFNRADDARSMRQSWDSGDYQAVIQESQTILKEHPMDGQALVFAGFSHFYTGVNQVSDEQKENHLNRTVVFLRKALVLDHPPLAGQLNYVLGKAYYHKGKHYYDLAVQYLEKSVDLGYLGDDTYEYIALAYAGMGMLSDSASNLLKAIDQKPSDLLFLTLSQTYAQMGETRRAEQYLTKAIDGSADAYLIQQAHFELGKILLDKGEMDRAQSEFRQILESNPKSADAHYYLGKVYEAAGERDKARYEWREALRIDPNHTKALQDLRNN